MKTSELTGAALDWAVTKLEYPDQLYDFALMHPEGDFHYSTNWELSGPILDRIQGFIIKQWLEGEKDSRCQAGIHNYEGNWVAFGSTLLIAGLRCYVASKLGDEVEIPEELL